MKRFLNGVKQVFKDFFKFLKKTFASIFETLKIFFASIRNIAMVVCFVVAIVFICLWNKASWCKIVGVGSLTIALALLAWYATIFFTNYVRIIAEQKRVILTDLANQFDKKEYLELKTPFNEKDEELLKETEKKYRKIMILCWVFFAVSLFIFISILF